MNSHTVAQYIEAVKDRPFEWGRWDCCQFVAEWIKEATGTDYRDQFPKYTGESDAREIIGSSGGLVSLVSSCLARIHPAHARKGDIVLSRDESGAALGICIGVQSAHVSETGIVYLQTLDGICAWRVE